MGKVIGGGLQWAPTATRRPWEWWPRLPTCIGPDLGETLAMTAGIKTLELLKQPGTYEQPRPKQWRASRTPPNPLACRSCGSVGAMFGFFLCEDRAQPRKAEHGFHSAPLHRAMLEQGIYLAPSAFEAGFTSLAHSDADIEATINAFRESFAAGLIIPCWPQHPLHLHWSAKFRPWRPVVWPPDCRHPTARTAAVSD